MTILTTIVASPLDLCSKLVLLVSFEEFLLAHHFGESSYEASHLIGIILNALIITIFIIIFFFTRTFFYNFLSLDLLASFESNVLFS
jgi:hypothetical protein